MKIDNYLYFDCYATIPCSKYNMQFVLNYMNCFNPSNNYAIKEKKLYKSLIEILKNLFNCNENQIIITSGGSEGNSTILFNKAIFNKNNKNIVISNLDHPSILNKAIELSKYNIKFKIYKAKNGIYNIHELLELINNDTSLLILTTVFSEIGNLNNIEDIAKKVKLKYPNIHIHLDNVQGFLKTKNYDLQYIDSISISFHKIGAMKGCGALILKNNKIVPLISGKQNNELRGGTIPIENIASAFYAIQENNNYEKKPDYFNYLLNNIKLYENDFLLYTNPSYALGNCLVIGFKNIKNKNIQDELCKLNIIVGTGTACSNNNINKNIHLFESFGEESKLYYPIRISWNKNTTKNDFDILLNELIAILKKMKNNKIGEN